MSTDTTTGGHLRDIAVFTEQLRGELGAAFSAMESKWLVHASNPLDCMGGFAEYCGALTLSMPTADSVCAAVQRRRDQSVQVHLMLGGRNGNPVATTFPLALWYHDGEVVEVATFVRRVEEQGARWAKPVVGALHVLLSSGSVPHLGGGLSIALSSELAWEAGPRVSATATAATMTAVCKCLNACMDPVAVALLCQQSQNQVMGIPCGPSAAAAALLGQAGALLQLRCQPLVVVGHLPLPDRVSILGIDCGSRHPAAADKFQHARAAAFMGRRIIERFIQARRRAVDWGGYLARLSVNDYVETYRDRLPTKMKGKDFLERFGDSGDPLTTVDAGGIYKIRSRAEHHIYENARVHQFVERLARAQRTGEQAALLEAGELMFASHWSYGQRCGLGSIETDKLVNCLRQRGPGRGIFGAKVCGAGSGGTVAVLMSDTDSAHQAVHQALEEYTQATGCSTRLLAGLPKGTASLSVRESA